jgi:tetratricopeptide (TPR) repeat protein/TolB-like protein
MAPEQLRGEKADVRSDIFNLGCLLYEMLTGRRAFRGESSHAVMLAILHADPDPISGCRSDVPPALEAVINRCLEKEPGERFDSARDVAFALQAVSTGRDAAAGPPPRRSVSSRSMWLKTAAAGLSLVALGSLAWLGARLLGAPPPPPDRLTLGVVPFDAAGEDATFRAFAVGLSENLSDDLALIAQQDSGIAWVVPAGEARSMGAATATALGRSFGVTIAVTGEVDRVGQRVRLALALVDPRSGSRLRAVTIEDAPGNLDAFQHSPAVQVAQQLGDLVTTESSARLQASATTTASSFDFFTRGRGLLALAGGRDDLTAALALLDQAVADDRLFADAWVLRAANRVALFHATGDEGLIQLGLEDAARARELDGRPEDSWRATAALHLAAGRPAEAAAALDEGVRLAPADADLRLELAEAYRSAGRWTDAEAELKRAIYRRPDYWVGYDRLAKLYLGRGMLEAAAVEFGHVVDCAPEFALGWVKLGGTNLLLERPEVARELLERSLEIEPTAAALSNLGSIHFDASRFAKAAEMYAAAVELDPDNYMMWGNLGYAYRFGVEPEKGEAAFRRAAELGRARLAETPDDTDLATDVAGYHAMLGETQAGLELLDAVAATAPESPLLISKIAETYSDLGERDRALEWVDRAFAAGEPRSRFEDRPTMSRLIADERYQALVEKYFGAQ